MCADSKNSFCLAFLFFLVVCLDWRESDDKPRLEINLPPTHILLMLAVKLEYFTHLAKVTPCANQYFRKLKRRLIAFLVNL